jgi:hypothetical protein
MGDESPTLLVMKFIKASEVVVVYRQRDRGAETAVADGLLAGYAYTRATAALGNAAEETGRAQRPCLKRCVITTMLAAALVGALLAPSSALTTTRVVHGALSATGAHTSQIPSEAPQQMRSRTPSQAKNNNLRAHRSPKKKSHNARDVTAVLQRHRSNLSTAATLAGRPRELHPSARRPPRA